MAVNVLTYPTQATAQLTRYMSGNWQTSNAGEAKGSAFLLNMKLGIKFYTVKEKPNSVVKFTTSFCWHVWWPLLLQRCACFALGFWEACEILCCRDREVEEYWLLECEAVQPAAAHWQSVLFYRKSPNIPTNHCRISSRSHSVAFHKILISLDETSIQNSKLIFRRVRKIEKSDY